MLACRGNPSERILAELHRRSCTMQMPGGAERPRNCRSCRKDEPAAASPFRDALHRSSQSMPFPGLCRQRLALAAPRQSSWRAVETMACVTPRLAAALIPCLFAAAGKNTVGALSPARKAEARLNVGGRRLSARAARIASPLCVQCPASIPVRSFIIRSATGSSSIRSPALLIRLAKLVRILAPLISQWIDPGTRGQHPAQPLAILDRFRVGRRDVRRRPPPFPGGLWLAAGSCAAKASLPSGSTNRSGPGR